MIATAPALSFDPVAHRYTWGARELLSVTTVLKEAGVVDDRYFTDDAAARGTAVHAAVAALDRGELGHVPEPWAGYVAAYQQFCAVMRPVWTHVEHPVADPIVGYAGTLDRAGTLLTGTRVVLDIKTGPVPAWVGAQTAAYRRCLPNPNLYRRAALQLKADGTFTLHDLTDRHDEALFLAALRIAIWKRANR